MPEQEDFKCSICRREAEVGDEYYFVEDMQLCWECWYKRWRIQDMEELRRELRQQRKEKVIGG